MPESGRKSFDKRNIQCRNSQRRCSEVFQTEKRIFDVSVIDPPRKGCTTESLDEVCRLTKGHIVYVSCNPATLARDLKYLCKKGCRIESIQPFDMFCHTYHVENVAIIRTSNFNCLCVLCRSFFGIFTKSCF